MIPQRFRGPADLHLHSQNSDGTESPATVMDAAYAHGIRTASLTDHDTTSGWGEAAGRAQEIGMTFIPGMEMSAKYGGRSVHVLSYLIDPDDADLGAMISRVRESREKRVSVMVERIGVDYDLTWADVVAKTTDGATVGRPHIADALIARGIVADRTEAFADILHPRSDYYVSLFAPDPLTAVSLVVQAGGVPVIAHPAGRAGLLPMDLLMRLVEAGLGGFELGHRENREPDLARLREVVTAHDLIVTGSSDYHGAGKPNLPGENTTTEAMVQRIIDRATGSAPVYA
jgi:predicted metal-dependent phosphoesterase TrpH